MENMENTNASNDTRPVTLFCDEYKIIICGDTRAYMLWNQNHGEIYPIGYFSLTEGNEILLKESQMGHKQHEPRVIKGILTQLGDYSPHQLVGEGANPYGDGLALQDTQERIRHGSTITLHSNVLDSLEEGAPAETLAIRTTACIGVYEVESYMDPEFGLLSKTLEAGCRGTNSMFITNVQDGILLNKWLLKQSVEIADCEGDYGWVTIQMLYDMGRTFRALPLISRLNVALKAIDPDDIYGDQIDGAAGWKERRKNILRLLGDGASIDSELKEEIKKLFGDME